MNKLTLIGLCGVAGSGKSTAARHLETFGFVRVSFADALRDLVYGQLGIKEHVKPTPPRLRRLLQVVGTEAFREYDPDHWVKQWKKTVQNLADGTDGELRVVVDDVRFLNEAQEIKFQRGELWQLQRAVAGLSGEAAKHVSEDLARDDTYPWDRVFHNNDSMESFLCDIEMAAGDMLHLPLDVDDADITDSFPAEE